MLDYGIKVHVAKQQSNRATTGLVIQMTCCFKILSVSVIYLLLYASRTVLLRFSQKCGTEVSRHATKVIINDKYNNYEYYLTQLLICTIGKFTKLDEVHARTIAYARH